ncbi:MAG: hypothetical protein LBL67_04445 [Coriobacteriales bacterium]|jgi:hypothetical protein|nr:hypothetical protein [Coriobacteriales bacterium]
MRKLGFIGHLKQQIAHLSDSRSLSIAKLARLAAGPCPRLREALYLYARLAGKTGLLMRNVEGTELSEEYTKLNRRFEDDSALVRALVEGDVGIPARYRKLFDGFQALNNATARDREVSLLLREKTLQVMRQKALSNYRIYTALGLNPGNINSYLKNADPSKLSRQTARRIYDYVLAA